MKRNINKEIEHVLLAMEATNVESNEYAAMSERLETLYRAKKSDNELLVALIGGAVNLVGIILVLNYEKLDIVTTKAFSLIKKV